MPTINLGNKKRKYIRTANRRQNEDIYNDPRWDKVCKEKRADVPYCEFCAKEGKPDVPSTGCGHKTFVSIHNPATTDELIYSYSELIALCDRHLRAHQKRQQKEYYKPKPPIVIIPERKFKP